MTICFVFKGGYTLQTKCKKFSVSRNALGSITGYECEGITENKPIELNFAELLCVYRVLSDEESDNG